MELLFILGIGILSGASGLFLVRAIMSTTRYHKLDVFDYVSLFLLWCIFSFVIAIVSLALFMFIVTVF